METENDFRLVYLLVSLVASELFFFLGIMIDKWYLLGIVLDFCVTIVVYAIVKIKSIEEATRYSWLKIDFVGDDDDIDKSKASADDEGLWYTIDGEPELVQISQPELKAILESDEIREHSEQIKSKIDAFYDLEPTVKKIEKVNDNTVACTIDLKEEHVDFFSYELDYFLNRELESHLPRRIARYIERYLVGPAWWFLKKDAVNTFSRLDSARIKVLRAEIRERFHKDINLALVQNYLKMKFENWFYPAEIEFFKSRGIQNFGQLLEKDLVELGQQFNRQFKRKTDFALRKFVHDLKREIVSNMSILLQSFSKNGLSKFVKLNEIPLFMVHYDYYFYKLRFKNRKVEVRIPETENSGTKIRTRDVVFMLPKLWGDAIRNRPREMFFNGIPITVSQTEKIQVSFIRMLLSGVPVYFINDCAYLRKRNKAKMDIEMDKVFRGFVETLAFLYSKKINDIAKTKTLYTRAQATIETQQETIDDLVASETENEDVQESFKRMRDKITVRGTPAKAEVPVFWFLLILVLVAGLFIGMNLPWV